MVRKDKSLNSQGLGYQDYTFLITLFQIDFEFKGLCAATFAPMKENG